MPLHTLCMLSSRTDPQPVCLLMRRIFSELLFSCCRQALRRERPTPVLTARGRFCGGHCLHCHMVRLPAPLSRLVLDGLTSYPLPCLILPVRWGSNGPICQRPNFAVLPGGFDPRHHAFSGSWGWLRVMLPVPTSR